MSNKVISTKILTIKHLNDFINGKFDMIPKSLGVELVNLGFLNYRKLTAENYNYWWYQVRGTDKINKEAFTFDWFDLMPTRKMKMIRQFIDFHKENESMYILINNLLNIEAARFDGFDVITGKSEFEKQIEFYYSKRKSQLFRC